MNDASWSCTSTTSRHDFAHAGRVIPQITIAWHTFAKICIKFAEADTDGEIFYGLCVPAIVPSVASDTKTHPRRIALIFPSPTTEKRIVYAVFQIRIGDGGNFRRHERAYRTLNSKYVRVLKPPLDPIVITATDWIRLNLAQRIKIIAQHCTLITWSLTMEL